MRRNNWMAPPHVSISWPSASVSYVDRPWLLSASHSSPHAEAPERNRFHTRHRLRHSRYQDRLALKFARLSLLHRESDYIRTKTFRSLLSGLNPASDQLSKDALELLLR